MGNNLRRGYTKSCGCLKSELIKQRETKRKVEGFLTTIDGNISVDEMADIVLEKEKINLNESDNKFEKAFRIAFYEWWQRNIREEQGVMRRYKSEHQYCEKCGKRCSPELHHIIPVKDFGGNERENIIWLCKECHRQIELEKYAKI